MTTQGRVAASPGAASPRSAISSASSVAVDFPGPPAEELQASITAASCDATVASVEKAVAAVAQAAAAIQKERIRVQRAKEQAQA